MSWGGDLPGDEWKGAAPKRHHKPHWVRWDPRSKWKRSYEWPLRKFYIINYDPLIWVPEEELVWDSHEDQAKQDSRDSWIVLGLLLVFFGSTVIVLYVMSLFFK